jgi:hypothetical protein
MPGTISLVAFGVIVPAFMFIFAAFAAHVMLPISMENAFKRLDAPSRVIAEFCIARSVALATAGFLVVCKIVFLREDDGLEIVSCWFVIIMLHQMGTYLFLRTRPPYISIAVFTMLCITCIMSYYDGLIVLSMVALGDIVCALQFSTYVTRNLGEPDLFPNIDLYHLVVNSVINGTLVLLLVRAIWLQLDDMATKCLCAYVYFRFRAPQYDIYFHEPPEPYRRHVLNMCFKEEDESVRSRATPFERHDAEPKSREETMVDSFVDGLKKA